MRSAVKWIVLGGACVAGVLVGVPHVSGQIVEDGGYLFHDVVEEALATFGFGG